MKKEERENKNREVGNKRAEMSSQMIIAVILLIASFVIILVVYFYVNWKGTIDDQACHNSVIIRGTLTENFDVKEAIPLKCKTSYVCLTENLLKGDCSNNLGKSYDSVRITDNKEKQQDQINMALAREVARCWSTMGEGKTQVFAREFSFGATKKCVICSRVMLDETITKDTNEINGFNKYLMSHKVPNKEISYWEFLTRSASGNYFVPSGQSLESIDKLDINDKAVLFIEVHRGKLPNWIGGGTGAALGAVNGAFAGFFVGGPVGAGIGLMGGAAGGAFIGEGAGEEIQNYFSNVPGDYASSVSIVDYSEKQMKELGCVKPQNLP